MHPSFRTMMMVCALTMLGGLLACHAHAQVTDQVAGKIILTEEESSLFPLPPSSPGDDTFAMTVTGTPETKRSKKRVTFQVCIQNGHVMVGNAIHELTATTEYEYMSRYKKTDCTPIRPTLTNRDIRKPGSWTTNTAKMKSLFLSPEEANKKYDLKIEPRIRFSRLAAARPKNEVTQKAVERIGGLAKGKYKVEAFTQFLQAPTGYQRNEIHNICKGTVSGYNNRFLPEDYGKKRSGNFNINGNFINTVTLVPFEKASLKGEWEIEYDPKGSHGSSILLQEDLQQKGVAIKHTVSVEWSFEPNDPCLRLVEMIENDLAYAEGFLDKTIRQKAGEQYVTELEKTEDSGKRPDPIVIYKCHVDRYAYERLHGLPPPPGVLDCENPRQVGGVGDEIGADAGCGVVDDQAYRENARRGCTPEEGVAGIIAHEKTHTEQCKNDPAGYNTTDLTAWGDNEVAAHLVGIHEMLKGIKRLCPNDDTSAIEIRIETINRSRLEP